MRGLAASSYVVSLLILVTMPGLSAAQENVDWKMFGGAPIDGDTLCFYEANGVVQAPDRHIRVWTKCLLRTALEQLDVEKEFDGRIMKAAADKIASLYIPPYASTISDFDFDKAITIVGYEQIADIAHIPPKARIYYELDCSQRRLRELSIEIKSVSKRNEPMDWSFIPPEGNGATLLKLLCPE